MEQSITNVLNDSKSFELLTFVSATGLIDKMDVRENRLERFRQILAEQCGGVIAELARRIDKSAPQVRVMLNPEKTGGRWIGEKLARDIELRLALPRGWLDQEGGGEEIPAAPLLTPRLQALVGLFEGLTEEQQEETLRELEETQRRNAALYAALKKKLG